jgi:hypothetical protein
MSYSYALVRTREQGPMSTWDEASTEPIGSMEEVKASIDKVFPGLTWSRWELSSGPRWASRSPSGDSSAEFSMSVPDGEPVRTILVSGVSRHQLEQLCLSMQVVAIDCQSAEVLRPQA